MVKVLIFGTGGVGSVYGWILDKGGAEVTVVCRSNFETVQRDGITIRSAIWGKVHYKPDTVNSVSAARGPFDYVLVCSKAFPGTSAHISDAVSPGTTIVLAQNGIGIEDEYAERFPGNPLVSGVVYLPVTQVEPGVVVMGAAERFEIGSFPHDAPEPVKIKVQLLHDLWIGAGATCKVFDDIQAQRWTKLALNASWNPMCALTLCDDANLIRSSPEALDMVKKVMLEVGAVAAATGYPVVTEATIQGFLKMAQRRLDVGGNEPSMLNDARNQRALEVEAILGNTVRIARRLNVATPTLDVLVCLARGLNYAITKPAGWKPIATVE
ncbi:hypothetical protein VTK73DRAFT_7878 [Phialemonium thermophilum]|uniref:2-dehydropantoate 2-reductase n=1 Tax=Phialemonium thermophilum TaxID=223376 RepID=A0ABR3XRB8_9PEZI